MKFKAWVPIILISAFVSCAGPSDPCEQWLAEKMCFTGAAVCDNGHVKVTCLDGAEAKRYINADPATVRRAANLEIGRVYDGPDYCWQCWELEKKGVLNENQ